MEWEELSKEELIKIVYTGEMAKILLSTLGYEEDYQNFKDEIRRNLDSLGGKEK